MNAEENNSNQKPDLSIVIVPFRSPDKLRITLTAIFSSKTSYQYEVIAVDNDPDSGTALLIEKEFPQVHLIRNSNEGFAKGNNRGFKVARGKYILILNPDTAVQEDTIQECMDFIIKHPDIGALGCKLLMEDGSLDLACRRSFPNPWNALARLTRLSFLFPNSKIFGNYNLTNFPIDQAIDVDSLSGAFMLVPRDVLSKVGMFDEEYFMYGEDIDLCYKIKQAGFRVYYYPKVFTYHYKGQSSKKVPYLSLYWFHNAMWIFYKKHYCQKYPFFLNWLVYIGIWGRFYFLLTLNFFRKNKYVSKSASK